jgi:hypothetical protein
MLNQRVSNENAIYEQLLRLRREGFEGVDLRRVSSVVAVASWIADGNTEPRRQLEDALRKAIQDLPNEREDDRIDVALAWYGLTDATRGKDRYEREKAGADLTFREPDSFRSHIQKPLNLAICRAILSRYELAAGRSAEGRIDVRTPEILAETDSPKTRDIAYVITARDKHGVMRQEVVPRRYLKVMLVAVSALAVMAIVLIIYLFVFVLL